MAAYNLLFVHKSSEHYLKVKNGIQAQTENYLNEPYTSYVAFNSMVRRFW
jgi:hypothetical protein